MHWAPDCRLRTVRFVSSIAVASLAASAAAAPIDGAWNIQRAGTSVTATGATDLGAFSKLSPWPSTDGRYLYSGCYDPSPLTEQDPASDRCFAIVAVADAKAPVVRVASVHTYDTVNSPSPRPTTPSGRMTTHFRTCPRAQDAASTGPILRSPRPRPRRSAGIRAGTRTVTTCRRAPATFSA